METLQGIAERLLHLETVLTVIMRRFIALAAAGVALVAAIGLLLYTATCGWGEVQSTDPGTTAGAECRGSLHPGLFLVTIGAGITLAAVKTRSRHVALVSGSATFLVGMMFGLSLGWWGMIIGALCIASGLVLPTGSLPATAASHDAG